jgi:phosphoglycerol transferase MdoB-like AlkP superfamily enzyme
MKRRYFLSFALNYLFIIILEILFKTLVINTYDIGLLYILVSSLFVSSIITFIMNITKNRIINRIISTIIYLLIVIVFGIETIYYSFYKTICGISGVSYGGQVMEFYSSILEHIIKNYLIILIYVFLFIIVIIINILKINSKRYVKGGVSLIIATFVISASFINISLIDSYSYELIYKNNNLLETTNRFGLISGISTDEVKNIMDFNEKVDNISFTEFTRNNELTYNELDIDFDSLIENETDSTIVSMHEYFKNESPSNKNEYTGIFKGKNLIFIVAEGFSPIAVNEELTPTLYKLVNSSFVFNNYYQPIFNCSTSDGEFISSLSILPGVSTCSMKSTSDVYLPYSLGNIMKKYNYTTTAIHGWTYTYYQRNKTLPNLGYTYYGYDRYKTGYRYALDGITDMWPTSDIDVINSSYDLYSSSTPFMTYYMTISGHLPYNFTGGNSISTKNKSLVENINASDSIKAYIASQIELDKSIELLMEKLESDGILDDTVIVLTADHYPYGLSTEDISSYGGYIKDENFDLYKNNLIIYNSGMETVEVNKYTSSLDLLPTILNLFGVEYDSRLLIGRDIFSTSEDLVIFNNKSWITSKGQYNYLTKGFTSFNSSEVDEEYIEKMNKIVDNKFKMSKLLISEDYYRKLGGI